MATDMVIEWETTHKNLVKLLEKDLLPWHYKQACNNTAHFVPGRWSDKTVPVEKFRQHYADTRRDDVAFVPGGYLVLRRWFPEKLQYGLFPPEPIKVIKGNCIISYDAGYEQAMRDPYLNDHFRDAGSPSRNDIRRRARLAENHIKDFFRKNYPAFYRPPTNEGIYERGSSQDFFLRSGDFNFPVDVKIWSYRNEYNYNTGTFPDPNNGKSEYSKIKNNTVLIWSEWKDDDSTIMCGVTGAIWAQAIGNVIGNFIHVAENYIWNIESLLVMLNMAKAGMASYKDFSQKLHNYQYSKTMVYA